MRATSMIKNAPIKGEDVSRWLVFTSFWGSIFYLQSCVSLIAGARQRRVELDTPTIGLGYGLHLLTFVAGGSLLSAAGSLIRGKATSEQSEEAISSGQLERAWPLQALGGAAGSLLPFGLAVASQLLASRRTGRAAISKEVNWPAAGATMVAVSGLTALAVARIAAWVAEDAKS